MLVLARRMGEAFVINNEIKIVYLGLNRYGQAKFGIKAPHHLSIHREEIQDKINSESKEENSIFKFCNE